MKKNLFAASVVAMALASCAGPQGWGVKGTIKGADSDLKLAVEACNAGHWYVLDSVDVKGGSFDYNSGVLAADADIMRVTYPGKGSVYFPVEGDDVVTITADAATFGTGHKLTGSSMAETVAAIDSVIAATTDLDELRKKLTGFIITDTTGIVAYYAVGKNVGNTLLFDPRESAGNRVYGAAAQVYSHYKPEDPHGEAIRSAYFAGRRMMGKVPANEAPEQVIEVPETGIIEIELYDNKGVKHSLKEFASKGNVVLLSFTAYDQQFSPAYNAILNDVYSLYHAKGLDIYQVAFDADEVAWKEAAQNLPWVTVWNSAFDGLSAVASYNVGTLPTTFIIDREGNIKSRVADAADLPKQVARLF